MSRIVFVLAAAVAAGALGGVDPGPSVTPAFAQHGAHDSHAQGGDAPHRRMQATLDEIDRGSPRGSGPVAEGPPAPHVRTGTHIIALRTAMFADARPKSARLLEAETGLHRLFAQGAADETRVRAAVADVERARTEVRLVHLLTHLRTRDVLTREPRRLYHEARWGK